MVLVGLVLYFCWPCLSTCVAKLAVDGWNNLVVTPIDWLWTNLVVAPIDWVWSQAVAIYDWLLSLFGG